MEFGSLVQRVVDGRALRREIGALLDAKRSGAELDRGPRSPAISEFLERELARLEAADQPPPQTSDPGRLDQLFVDILREVNGDSIEPADLPGHC